MEHTLISKIIIKGEIIAETGLMIGSSSAGLEIGGTDKQIIRNPANKMPYIPGSSLKGKMRSLLEQIRGTVDKDGLELKYKIHRPKQTRYCTDKDQVCTVFCTAPHRIKREYKTSDLLGF